MANFVYQKKVNTNMKLVGIIDTDRGVIEVDGVEKNILKTFADFNGAPVTITIKTEENENLDEPIEE